MSFRPDSTPDPKKEAVLANSPLTRTFLNQSMGLLNPQMWAGMMEEHGKVVEGGIEARVGRTWLATVVMPSVIMAQNLDVFYPADKSLTVDMVCGIIKMGYELETQENYVPLIQDLISRFADLDLFNPGSLITDAGKGRIADTFIGLLEIGCYIKKLPSEGVSTLYGSKSPSGDTVRDFIKGLEDIDGI